MSNPISVLIVQIRAARRAMVRQLQHSEATVKQLRECIAKLDGMMINIRTGQVPLLETKISDLELSPRAYNALKYDNIETLRDLMKLTEGELVRIPNFGRVSLAEVRAILDEKGLRLRNWNEDENDGTVSELP